MKYFMEDRDTDGVSTLDCFKEMIEDGDEEEIELFEMKRDYGGPMWCDELFDFVEKGDCGRWCDQYKPCNRKSGRCRNLENGYMRTGKKFILTKSGLKEVDCK